MSTLTADAHALAPHDESRLEFVPLGSPATREVRELRDMHGPESPAGLRVFQVTRDARFASSHIYMESPVFTPDSRRFIFQRGTRRPGTINMQRRARQYWICDMDDDFAIRPITDEPWVIAPAVSPDGEWCYYFTNRLDPRQPGDVELRRVSLRSFQRETVARLGQAPSGAPARPSRIYSLSSIRADGGAIVTGAFFGDGVREPGLHGVLKVDLRSGEASAPLLGHSLYNTHPQYYRGQDPAHLQDILVQENFCDGCSVLGEPSESLSGCYLRVIRDDGSNYRTVPTGNADERCHGHQEWRGETDEILVGVDWIGADGEVDCRPIILARPVPDTRLSGAVPTALPGAATSRRNLASPYPEPAFAHTAFDATGTRFATDWWNVRLPSSTARLCVGTLPAEVGATLRLRFLLFPRTNWQADQFTHPHPCLAPDGRTLLFNSTHDDGSAQIYVVTGFDYP